MKRRELLGTVGTGMGVGIAGCSAPGSDPTPTPTPTPAESELRLTVENLTNETQTVEFTLRVTAGSNQSVETFEMANIEPGESRQRAPQSLRAGEYQLEISMPGNTSSRPEWVGHECPRKEITIRLRDTGFEIRDVCSE